MGVAIAMAAVAATFAGLVIWLGTWLRSEVKESRAATDTAHQQQMRADNTQSENEALKVRIAGVEQELRVETERREIAEAQRNRAYETARDQIVNRLKKANVTDAPKLFAEIASLDFRVGVAGIVREVSAVPETASAKSGDGLPDKGP